MRIYRRGKVYWVRAQRQNREYRRSLKTTDRAIADRRARSWLGELDAIAWGEKPRRTYAEAEEKFIREHLTAIKRGSALRYGDCLRHLSEHFGAMTLDQITSATLSDFETKRRLQGLSPSTIRLDLRCLSSMLTSCVDWEWIEANIVPAFLHRRAKRGLKEGPPRTRYLTEAEEIALLNAAKPKLRQAMVLAIDTGLRREELFSLQWWQVDLDRGLITTTTNTKSGRPRVAPLPERSCAILAALPRGADHVLINPVTGRRYGDMGEGLALAQKRAGIGHVCWHDLRRTAGCRWLQRDGKRIEEVSVLLGHSTVKMTEECYAFLEAEQVAASLSGRTKAGTGTFAH
jgi:integrase